MLYNNNVHPNSLGDPKILYRNDSFLSPTDIVHYQQLLQTPSWVPAPSLQSIQYFSKDLFQQYMWDGNWDSVQWRDDASPDWDELYNRISKHLPKHRVHWADVKITPPLSTGTPRHRDKDPWLPGGSDQFDKAITVLLNLNNEWQSDWGGEFVLWSANKNSQQQVELIEFDRIAISPGQLVVMENCWHSIAPITQMNRSRISFILHVLQYKQV